MKVESVVYPISVGREPFTGFPPPNSFLVCGSDTSVLIDSGWAGEEDHAERIKLLESYNVAPISKVILTHRHPDHAGGALALHSELNANLACHDLEKNSITADRLNYAEIPLESLTEGTSFDLGGLAIEIIDTPGHTVGCIAPYIPELGALFASDSVMGISTTVVRPTEGDLGKYEESLRKMKKLSPRIIYSGHGPVITEPIARLDYLLEHRLKRENELFKLLKMSSMKIEELCDAMYAGISEPRKVLAKEQLLSTLLKLKKEGVVEENQDAIWQIT